MRTFPRIPIALAVCVALWSTTALAQKTTFDYRRRQNFAGLRTFAFKDTVPLAPVAEKTTTYDSPLMVERTRAAIAAQLERRGLRRDDENPDVYILTRRTYRTEYTYYGPYGWTPYSWYAAGWDPYGVRSWPWYAYDGYGPMYLAESVRGTLVIDVEDAATGELLWRGVGEKHVHEHSKPSSRDRRVTKEVAEILKHFPPPARY